MDHSVNGPQKMGNLIIEEVWYEGTDALKKGEGLCYNTDYGTAADFDGRRCNRVERPSLSNNFAFAGVVEQDYSAKAAGQRVRICVPGSKGAPIALGVDTTIGTGLLTFVAGASGSHRGRFYTGKYKGRGSAIPRQTVTALLESSMTGAWSLATDGITLTVVATAGLAAGDTVVLVGGENEDDVAYVVPGKYTIASITSGTVLVLSSSAVASTPAAAVTCTGFAYTGNPTCQADLLEGDESGGVEFISPPNAGLVGQTYMVGGVSYVCGGVTLAADVDITFAQGALPGDKKAFICLGTLGTSDFTVDLATNGIQIDGSTALAEVNAIDAATEACYLEFNGVRWFLKDISGAGVA
jgi:hypothetical protein